MRSFSVCTVAVLAVSTAAASVHADTQTAKVRPHVELAPSVRIAGFGRPAGQTGAYTGGALGLAVDVENTGNAVAEGIRVKVILGDQTLESTVSIPAHDKRVVVFSDADGLASSCAPKTFKLSLAGAGTSAAIREASVTPSCTFSSSVEQTWNKLSPDAVAAQKAGNAYLTNPTLVAGPVCGKGPTLKATIVNSSAKSSPSLVVQAKSWDANASVVAQTPAAFPLAGHEQKELLLTPLNGASDVPATMKLGIVDWSKSLGGHTSDGGILVHTSRSCSLAFALE